MRSFDKGTITELEVQFLLVKKGYQVFTPINEGCKIDLIYIDENNFSKRVQVKKSTKTSCGFSIDLTFKKGTKRTEKAYYSENDIDFFGTTNNGILYLIPIGSVLNKRSIVLRTNMEYKNQNSPLFAKDFEIK